LTLSIVWLRLKPFPTLVCSSVEVAESFRGVIVALIIEPVSFP
jgi:hypothetical protein